MKALRRILARPQLALAWAGGLLLAAIWITWATYVGTVNGANAAIGVLITWPLLFSIAALAGLTGWGLVRLVRGERQATLAPIAGAGAPELPEGHDSATTVTFPS